MEKILIVDDDPLFVKAATAILKQHGYEVNSAGEATRRWPDGGRGSRPGAARRDDGLGVGRGARQPGDDGPARPAPHPDRHVHLDPQFRVPGRLSAGRVPAHRQLAGQACAPDKLVAEIDACCHAIAHMRASREPRCHWL